MSMLERRGRLHFEGAATPKYRLVSTASGDFTPRLRGSARSLKMFLLTRSRVILISMMILDENTRASYPLEFIDNAVRKEAGIRRSHLPDCDASGVMRHRTPDAGSSAVSVHFGYTSKIAGTEVGLRDEPEITFSAVSARRSWCITRIFMRIFSSARSRDITSSAGWSIPAGWAGRMALASASASNYTRALLSAALNGKLDNVNIRKTQSLALKSTQCPMCPRMSRPGAFLADQEGIR